MCRKRPRASMFALCLGTSFAALLTATPAFAQQRIVSVEIQRQTVEQALQELARQAGVDILFSREAVAGLQSPRVSGRMTAEETARAILAGTSLDVVKQSEGSLIVRPRRSNPGKRRAEMDKPMPTQPVRYAALQQSTLDSASSNDTPMPLGEIIVTAQRRAQRLEDVPISIAVASAEQLEKSGVQSIHDLAQITPGVSVTRINVSAAPTIRGISSAIAGPGADPNVATYVDGFYTPSRTGSQLMGFNNIQQIEILKGPQGTLFGRNATGGALLIRTLDPSHTPHFRIEASYGRFDSRILNAYATTSLTDNLAVDLGVHVRRYDGYIKDAFTGENSAPIRETSFRSKWLFTPSENSKFTLILEHNKTSDATGLLTTTFAYSLVDSRGLPNTKEKNRTSNAAPVRNRVTTDAISLKSEIDLGAVTLNSLTGYRRQTDRFSGDLGGSPVQVAYSEYKLPEDTFSQELNLASSEGDALTWIVGLYYYNDYTRYRNRRTVVFGRELRSQPELRTEAIAAFADGTANVADGLFLTLGARYSYEKKKYNFQTLGITPIPGVDPVEDSDSWRSFTPRAALRWELSPRTNLYASVSRGFKSGAYNATVNSPVINVVKPETITAYEVGFKISRPVLKVNGSAFYYDYKKLQDLIALVPGSVSILANAASAEIYGADIALTFTPSDRLSIQAGAAWTHARYKKYTNAVVTVPNGATLLGTIKDVSGFPIPRQADFTGNVGVTYRLPTLIGEFDMNANAYLTSDIPFTPDKRLTQDGYGLLNMELGWTSRDERYRLSVYGTNLTNTQYRVSMYTFSLGDRQLYGTPISYGVKLQAKF